MGIEACTKENGFGIENVTYSNNGQQKAVNTSAWAGVIAHDIASWLGANNCDSVVSALETGLANQNLFACYCSYDSALARYNQNPQMYQMN